MHHDVRMRQRPDQAQNLFRVAMRENRIKKAATHGLPVHFFFCRQDGAVKPDG